MAMTLTKEAKVGLLALVAGIMLYVGFNFLKGSNFFSPTNKYFVVYDNVEGLATSNQVVLNGVNVGRVSAIKLLTDKNNLILVVLEMNSDVVIGDSTRALLSNDGLLGGKSIHLQLGKNSKILESGDTLIGAKPKGFAELLSAKAMPIMANLDSTVYKLNALFGDELGLSIKNTLHNFELASYDLKLTMSTSKRDIAGITNNLNALSGSLKETERAIKPLLQKMSSFADSLNDLPLKKAVANANAAMKNLNEVSSKINEGNGSIGLLINDKSLYQKLDNSAKDLDLLLIDVKKNPKRYVHFSVFGRKDKEAKLQTSTP
jgi:phospholipid/cholesterol/gamma-HCH transport system substrate-binding protein